MSKSARLATDSIALKMPASAGRFSRQVLSSFLLFFLAVGAGFAQTDFFWSDKNLNSGAVNEGEVVVAKSVGSTGSLFLYYSTNGPSQADIDLGAFLDIATSQSGIIRFTGAETFNFPITVQGIEIGRRWFTDDVCEPTAGELGTVKPDFINEWGAFTVFNGEGLKSDLITPPFLDLGYDSRADAFLFGRIDYEVVGKGCVQLHAGPGKLGVGRSLSGVAFGELLNPTFGSALISVGSLALGDVDLDGKLTLLDVAPFVQQIEDNIYSPEADTNCDGLVTLLDVQPFVQLISGHFDFIVRDPSEEKTDPVFGMLGDITNDGFINMMDVACFRNLIADCGFFPNTDINGDGNIDLLDLCPFILIILEQE